MLRRAIPALFAALLLGSLLGGCSVYRLDIQQGNYVDREMLDQLEVGMTRDQVRFVLGTPMVQSPLHPDRWDYPFYYDSLYEARDSVHRLTVYFENDRVSRIYTTGFEEQEKGEDGQEATEPVVTPFEEGNS